VIMRFSHAIADGMAMMHVLLSLTDPEADAPWPEPPSDYTYRPGLLTRLVVPAMSAVDGTLRVGETVLHEGMETLIHPSRLLAPAQAGTSYALALGKVLLLGVDQHTLFKGTLGPTKRAAWTQPLALAEVKAVGKIMCGTINDVLLSCVAGGLRRYIEARGGSTEGLNIRALVPVNLRKPEEMDGLGNRFGLIFLSLPLGIADPLERLHTLKWRMDAIKNSPEALVTFDILNTIGLTSKQVERMIVNIFAPKASAVMTNVPGPRQTLYLAGSSLRSMMFWVPTSGDISLGVSIFSYDGQVIVGIATDAGLAPDPESIAAAIETDFEEMQEYVRCAAEDYCNEYEPPAVAEDIGLPMEAPAPLDLFRMKDVPCDEVRPEAASEIARPRNGAQAGPATAPVPPAVAGNGYCQAITRSGQPCRNHALPGQTSCRVHTPRE